MKSPNPDGISIRIEVNVPSGGRTGADRGQAPPRRRTATERSLTHIEPPDNASGVWSVLPDGNGLGTICALATFDEEQDNVWLAVFPTVLYPDPGPDDTFHHVDWEVMGTTDDNLTWLWRDANPVRGAAHLPYPNGAPNMLALWHQPQGGADVFYGATAFLGQTDSTPCGSGSGSEGLGGELGSAAVLWINISDGPQAGRHAARRVSRLSWLATIGSKTYLVTSKSGRDFIIRGDSHAIPSKTVNVKPFSATFSGRLFDSTRDVVVSTK